VSAQAPPIEGADVAVGDVARTWLPHLASLLLPGNALLFLFTGPHAWYASPLFMLPVVLAFVLDRAPRVERRQPAADLPAWPFDLLVYVLAAMQLAVVFGIGRMFAVQDVFSVDMVVLVTVVGGSSGFSIITAHELIHRRKRWEQGLGRLLLCTVLQEHFFTEHLRGHHVRVGLPDDPATARFGESYQAFYRRTVPAQFRSAWRLEAKRLAARDADAGSEASAVPPSRVPRLFRNRILQGLVVGWGLAFAVGWTWGLAALVAFLLQALFSSRLLEAVNYFEHWGLTRTGSRVRPRDSWDTHSWFTYYGLTGLSRHADHHYEPARPFQQLRVHEGVPMLPGGYVVMVDMVMTKNDEFQRLANAELRRCGLGPFAVSEAGPAEGDGVAAAEVGPAAHAGSPWLARWAALPIWLRGGAVALAVVLLATAGERLVDGLVATSPLAHALANAGILAAFVVGFRIQKRLEQEGSGALASWSVALTLLVGLGLVAERLGALFA
jgi:alkane 1-monooxygenase